MNLPSIHCPIPQMAVTAEAGPSLKPRAWIVPHRGTSVDRGPKASQRPIFCCFPTYISRKLDRKTEQLGFETVPIGDAGIVGRGLIMPHQPQEVFSKIGNNRFSNIFKIVSHCVNSPKLSCLFFV